MTEMAPDYDQLCSIQKVEVFKYALANTTGLDLYKVQQRLVQLYIIMLSHVWWLQVMWLKSAGSEVWLARRSNFTRSLGTMSMVGYILGLGDRHPCNLMLDRQTGKIIHIDFGDCFEVPFSCLLMCSMSRYMARWQ